MDSIEVQTIAGWTLGLACAGSLAYWTVVLLHLRAACRSMPTLREGIDHFGALADEGATPAVCVVIPAHNEEKLLPEALDSILASNYEKLSIVVVADRCTDGTVALLKTRAASDSRLRWVELHDCPPDWSGKCHAAWQGAKCADSDWLLFTDADTLFAPDLIRGSIGLASLQKLDFLSLLGSLSCDKGFERTAQPVAAMSLIRMYPIQRANRRQPERRRPFANGQFMLFRRDVYLAFGTHERIKSAILEDLMFARRLNHERYRLGVVLAGDLFRVRMYDDRQGFERGWKRIFTEAANRNLRRLRFAAWRLVAQAFSPLLYVVALAYSFWVPASDPPLALSVAGMSVAAAAAQLAALSWAYRLQGASVLSIWRHPAGCLLVARIFRDAAEDLRAGRGIEWAQLRYDVKHKEE